MSFRSNLKEGISNRSVGGRASPRRWLPYGQGLPEDVWRRRHTAIVVLMWLHVVVIPIYAAVRGFEVGHGLLEAAIVAGPAAIAMWSRLGRSVQTIAASLGILFSSAVLIHLSGGLIEMHFHFFVMVTVVALYQDWIPFLLAIGYVLVHHGVMGVLDPRSVYNHPAAIASPWRWAAVHAFFISGISAVCLVTWKLNETLFSLRTRAEQEKALLYEAERRARKDAEDAQARLEILAEVGRKMTFTLDPDRALENIAQVVVPALADLCLIDVAEEDGSLRRVGALVAPSISTLDDEMHLLAPDPSDVDHPIVGTLKGSGAAFFDDASAGLILRMTSEEGGLQEALLLTSAIVVPMSGRGRILGTLSLATTQHSQRRFNLDDFSLAEQIGRRAGTALENARLYAKERDVAKTLQQSLLPRRLPEVPGLTTVARYLPGGPGVDVGGDWYDVFVLPGGDIGVVMGDVMGRGVQAAALMGQLRNALRAFAFDSPRPSEVMNKLHRLVQSDDSDYLATAIFGVLSLEMNTLRVANAAHPPPLIVSADECVRLVGGSVSPPLGAVPHTRYVETTAQLDELETLLLYTDGLIEDRETSLEDGLIRVTAALQTAPQDLSALPDHVLRAALTGRAADDDVAMLAIRTIELGDRLSLRVPSDARMLAPLRGLLRRWLRKVGVAEDKALEVLVACGEACTNAIEHGSHDGTGYFEFDARVDHDIVISVRDEGHFEASRRDGRGRGLKLMRALTDGLDVDKVPGGTHVRLRYQHDSSGLPT